ncbi:hypothetical protein R6Q59_003054 [Mikania micrantha]
MAKTYGPLIWIQLGSTPVVIVSSTDAAREIMKTHDIIFSNRPFTSVLDRIFYGSKDVVFSPYGEHWRKMKSICALHLLSSKQGVIEEHVNKKDFGIKGHDLVDILLEIQKDKSTGFELERYMIKAIILNMYGAGTDTTSTSSVWAIGELLRNPRVMKELQQEARKIRRGRPMIPEEDVEKMPYLKAVFKEALRLHVPIPLLVPRQSTQDVKIFGYDIPSATINELVLANLAYKFEFALEGEHSLDMSETDGMTAHKKYPILVKATLYE